MSIYCPTVVKLAVYTAANVVNVRRKGIHGWISSTHARTNGFEMPLVVISHCTNKSWWIEVENMKSKQYVLRGRKFMTHTTSITTWITYKIAHVAVGWYYVGQWPLKCKRCKAQRRSISVCVVMVYRLWLYSLTAGGRNPRNPLLHTLRLKESVTRGHSNDVIVSCMEWESLNITRRPLSNHLGSIKRATLCL